MSCSGLSRRSFLRALGAASGTLAFPRILAADEGLAPKRLLLFITMQGTVYPSWKMRPGGEGEEVDFEFPFGGMAEAEFSEALRPLHRHRDKLLVLDGLSLIAGELEGHDEPHQAGWVTALTGSIPDPLRPDFPRSESIDRAIAAAVGGATRFATLDIRDTFPDRVLTFDRGGVRSAAHEDALSAWTHMQRSTGAMTPAEHAYHTSVIDRTAERYEALRPYLDADERARLERHAELVRDLERRLASSPPACPDLAAPLAWDGEKDAWFRTAVTALACDLTRVVTLHQGTLLPSDIGAPPGDVHADYAHAVMEDEDAYRYMTNYAIVHAEQFANLVDMLDSVDEGTGTLLDNTTVVWVNEMGNGYHGLEPWPVVVAGGRDFRLGRYVRWAPRTEGMLPGWRDHGRHFEDWPSELGGMPHNHFLVSMAQAFGLTDDEGNPRNQFGVASVTNTNGDAVDLRGPLDRL